MKDNILADIKVVLAAAKVAFYVALIFALLVAMATLVGVGL